MMEKDNTSPIPRTQSDSFVINSESEQSGSELPPRPSVSSLVEEARKEGIEDKRMDELRDLTTKLKKMQKYLSQHPEHRQNVQMMGQMAALSRQVHSLMNELGLKSLHKYATKDTPQSSSVITGRLLSFDEMSQLTAVGDMSDRALRDLRAAKVGVVVPAARPTITSFVPPQMPKLPSVQEIAAMMHGIPSLVPLQAVQRSEKDPYYKKGGGIPNLATSLMTQNFVSQDGQWIAMLQGLGGDDLDFNQKVYDELAYVVNHYYAGSGPLIGWFNRIKEGKSKVHPKFTLTEAEMQQIFEVLPWDPARGVLWKEATLETVLKMMNKINPRASSGFPRNGTKSSVWEFMIKDTYQYYQLIQENKFAKYKEEHPGEFLTTMKNKMDRYEINDWGKKIRPYSAGNGGESVLYSGVIQAYSKQLLGFWEHPKSCNAHGFSWAHGGGQRLYEWLERLYKEAPPGVYAIGYSDDGLWVIIYVDKDGKRRMLVGDLDIKHCDMSVGNSFMPIMARHVIATMGKDVPKGWLEIARSAVRNIWNQVVILYSTLIYKSTDQVHSGQPGTAEADQVAFSTDYVVIRNEYARLLLSDPEQDPKSRFEAAAQVAKKRLGLEFKPYTFTEFLPNQPEYPFEFLGKYLKVRNGWYLPYTTLRKTIIQCVVPKKMMKGQAGLRAWMERARGLAVTSLWAFPALFEKARQQYNLYKSQGVQPADLLDDDEFVDIQFETLLGQQIQVTFPNGEFPDLSWVLQLYDTRAVGSLLNPMAGFTLDMPKTAADAFREMFEEDLSTGSWADQSVEMENLRTPLYGSGKTGEVSIKQAIIPEQQYQVQPLPQHVKDAYNAARKEIKNRLYQNFAPPLRLKVGSQLRGLLRQGARDLKFDSKFKQELDSRFEQAYDNEFVEYSMAGEEYEDDSVWEPFTKDEEDDDAFLDRYEKQYVEHQRQSSKSRRSPAQP